MITDATYPAQTATTHHSRSLRALIVVVVAGIVLRSAVVAAGWFYWDDLLLIAQSREFSSPSPELLLTPHDGHLMPGAWLLIWLLGATTTGFAWPAAVILTTLLNAVAIVAVASAANTVARTHAWWITVFYVLSPLVLPVATWTAAALNSLPLHAGIAIVLKHGWLTLNSDRKRDPWIVAAAIMMTAMFSERVLFTMPIGFIMVIAWTRARGLKVQRTRVKAWTIATGIPVLVIAVLYATIVGDPRIAAEKSTSSVANIFIAGYTHGFLPALTGGPIAWQRWDPGPPFTNPTPLLTFLGAVVALALVVYAARSGQGRGWAMTAVLLCLTYPALPFAAIALVRSSADTATEITQTLRHFAEVAVFLTLTVGVLATLESPRRLAHRRTLGTVILSIWCVIAVAGTVAYTWMWHPQPARDYFLTLESELKSRDQPILNQAVPLEVLMPLTYPNNQLDHLIGAPQVQAWTSAPELVDATGTLRPAELVPLRSYADTCVDGPTTLNLDGPLFDHDWIIRINYLAERDSFVDVALDGESITVPVDAGLHQVYVQVVGGGEHITITANGLCLGRGEVGILGVSEQSR